MFVILCFPFQLRNLFLGLSVQSKKGWTMEMHLFLWAEVHEPVYAFFAILLCWLLKTQEFFEVD